MTTAPQAPMNPPTSAQGNGLALAGMILGIIAIVFFWFWPIAIIGGIVGLILSIIGKSKAGKTGVGGGKAKAGLILSILAIVLGIVWIVAIVAFFAAAVQNAQSQFPR